MTKMSPIEFEERECPKFAGTAELLLRQLECP